MVQEVIIKQFDVVDFNKYVHKLSDDVPPTEFVGGLFPRKHISIIASKAGVGKTWYILKLIVDLSRGGTIFISQAYNEPPRKSLLLCGETGASLVQERYKLIRGLLDDGEENVVIISAMDLQRDGFTMFLNGEQGKDSARLLNSMCRQFSPDLLVLDTLMSFRSDDENTAQDTSLIIGRLQAIAENNNIAIIVTHHLRKTDKKERGQIIDQDEIIGSSALVRRCGCAFVLVRAGSDFALRPVKTWWKNPPTTTYRMINYDDKVIFMDSDGKNNPMMKKQKITDYINSHLPVASFTVEQITNMFDVSETVAREILTELCLPPTKIDGKYYYSRA